MEITFHSVYEQSFSTRVAGVTKRNSDGSDRQQLLRKCRAGDRVNLRRETENRHDRFAVAVHLGSGAMIGYVPAGDVRLAEHLDRGGTTSAKILKIMGGRTWWQRLSGEKGATIGCIIEIVKKNFDWKKVFPYMNADGEIASMVRTARPLEKTDQNAAIEKYREAIQGIIQLDAQGPIAAAWRTTSYPINRLSLTLDRAKRRPEALSEIRDWERYDDPVGVTASDRESTIKRKVRLEKKVT